MHLFDCANVVTHSIVIHPCFFNLWPIYFVFVLLRFITSLDRVVRSSIFRFAKMKKSLKSIFKPEGHCQHHIRQHRHVGEASKFYFACENGDIETVKQMLATIPYDQLNQVEPNGSTALHAATYFGYLDIVRLLLHQYGCQRHQKNRHGFTAYEVAQTDEMRQLYHRPSNKNQFSDGQNDSRKKLFQIVSSASLKVETDSSGADDDNIVKPDQHWVVGYETNREVENQLVGVNGFKALFQSRIGRHIMGQAMKLKIAKDAGYSDEEYAYVTDKKYAQEALQKILDEHVTSNHPEYEHCCQLLKEYIHQGIIESLLTLYTMETPFYSQLWEVSSPLGFPLFLHLPDLKERYYQGQSYRGVKMTRHDLCEYRWALKNKDSLISSLTFASTSIIRAIAEQFTTPCSPSPDEISVLLIFHFPQPCDTAINLSKIPEHRLPCISNFEDEQEVLVGPRTFFKVKEIQINQLNGQHMIYLENVCGQHQTVLKAIKFFVTMT